MAKINTLDILSRAMDASSLRHTVISDNIANVDTPGFKRSDVTFENELQRILNESPPRLNAKQTASRHLEFQPSYRMENLRGRIMTEVDTFSRNDENNVDVEVEMANLAKNTMYYQALSQRVRGKFTLLNNVVQRAGSV